MREFFCSGALNVDEGKIAGLSLCHKPCSPRSTCLPNFKLLKSYSCWMALAPQNHHCTEIPSNFKNSYSIVASNSSNYFFLQFMSWIGATKPQIHHCTAIPSNFKNPYSIVTLGPWKYSNCFWQFIWMLKPEKSLIRNIVHHFFYS